MIVARCAATSATRFSALFFNHKIFQLAKRKSLVDAGRRPEHHVLMTVLLFASRLKIVQSCFYATSAFPQTNKEAALSRRPFLEDEKSELKSNASHYSHGQP